MRWTTISMILLAVLSLGCVLSVDAKDSLDSITVEITLSVPSRIEKEDGLSGTVHLLRLLDCYEVKDFSAIPVRSGPLDFVSIFSLSGKTYISFQTIVPSKPVITISGRKINARFEKSSRRYDYSFNDSMELGDVMKYFSETLGVNVSISSDVLHRKLPSLKLENTTPEDAFRTILLSLGLVYAYFPNGVMYISGSLEDLKKKLLEVWGVSSEEALLDAVRAGVLKTLKDEAMIFTMAPSESLRGIIGESRGEYYEIVDVIDKDSAKSVLNEMFGEGLKVITTLPGSAVMVYGKAKDVEGAVEVLRKTGILTKRSRREQKEEKLYKVVEVVNPEAAKGLIEGIYPSVKVVPVDGKVVIYGSEEDIEAVEGLLKSVGFLGVVSEESGEASPIAKPVGYEIIEVDDPEEVAKYLEGILDGLKVVVGKGRIAVVGRKDQIEEAKKLVEKLKGKEEEEIIDVWNVSDPETVSKILSELFEGLKVVPGKGEVIVKGYKSLVEKAKDLLNRTGAFEEKKSVDVLRVNNPDEISRVLSELLPDLKVITLRGRILVSGNGNEVKTAVSIAKRISKTPGIHWKVVNSGNLSDRQMEILKRLGGYFGVEVFGIPALGKIVLMGEDEAGFEKVEKMMNELSRGSVRIPVLVKEGKVSIDVDGMPASKLVEEVLRGFGKGVVVVEDISTPIRMSVTELDLEDFLDIMKTFGVSVQERDGIYFVKRLKMEKAETFIPTATRVEVSEPLPPSTTVSPSVVPSVRVVDGLIDVECEGCELSKVIEDLSKGMGLNLVFVDRPDFPVTMNMKRVKMEELMDAIRSFGYDMEEKDGIYYVKKIEEEKMVSATSTVNFEVKFRDGKAFVLAVNVPLATIIRELSKGFGVNVVMIDSPSESVSVKVDGMSFDDLEELLDRFGYTLERVDGINYLIKKGRTLVGKIVYGFEKLQSLVESLGGQMFYDSTTGMVIARNLSSGAYSLVKKYMDTLKESPPQVSIEVKLIEKTGNEGLDIESLLSLDGGQMVEIYKSSAGMGMRLNTAVISASSYEEILKGLLGGRVDITLEGVKSRGKTRLIASPSVTVISGEAAKIFIGGENYVMTSGGTPVKYESGVNLNITPYVRPDGKIDLKVEIELSDISQSGPELTVRKTRSAQTRVVLEDGQTLVIGGLMREITEDKVNKLPILGDLPIVGWLFRSKSERKEISNLTIFITAKVVKE